MGHEPIHANTCTFDFFVRTPRMFTGAATTALRPPRCLHAAEHFNFLVCLVGRNWLQNDVDGYGRGRGPLYCVTVTG